MRAPPLFLVVGTLSLTASCVRSPMLADASDAIDLPTASDAVIEMPPLIVESSYAQKIAAASAEATRLATHRLNCPAVWVLRADAYERADGTPWTVVRMLVCGEQRVYERTRDGWNDATARLR